MGWWSKNIMGGDTPLDFEDEIYGTVQIEKYQDIKDETGKQITIKNKLTANDFDSNPDMYRNILEVAYDPESEKIGKQVFAYLLMKAGGKMTDEVREETTQACLEDSWGMRDEGRKAILDDLRNQIETYRNDPVELEEDRGLFAAIGDRLAGGNSGMVNL